MHDLYEPLCMAKGEYNNYTNIISSWVAIEHDTWSPSYPSEIILATDICSIYVGSSYIEGFIHFTAEQVSVECGNIFG